MVFADRLFVTLDATEVEVVARAVSSCERLRLVPLARAVTRLGNGWLYPLVSLVAVLAGIESPARFLVAAAASLAMAFAIYPVLKRFLRRRRPCDYDPSLVAIALWLVVSWRAWPSVTTMSATSSWCGAWHLSIATPVRAATP